MFDEQTVARFWSKVEIKSPDECWPWMGWRHKPKSDNCSGYGGFQHHGINEKAHRVAYKISKGPIPEGLVLDHLCRERCCVNPAHLEAVTMGENTFRGETIPAAYRSRGHCCRGHEYTKENLFIKKRSGRTYRACRACAKIHRLRNRAKSALAALTPADGSGGEG